MLRIPRATYSASSVHAGCSSGRSGGDAFQRAATAGPDADPGRRGIAPEEADDPPERLLGRGGRELLERANVTRARAERAHAPGPARLDASVDLRHSGNDARLRSTTRGGSVPRGQVGTAGRERPSAIRIAVSSAAARDHVRDQLAHEADRGCPGRVGKRLVKRVRRRRGHRGGVVARERKAPTPRHELAKAQPKRLRYRLLHCNRLLHIAARLAFSGRRAKLRLQRTWPWVNDLVAAFDKLKALPATPG